MTWVVCYHSTTYFKYNFLKWQRYDSNTLCFTEPNSAIKKKKTNTNISTKPIENLHAWLCWTAIWVHYSPYFKHLVRENKSWCKIYQQVSEYECLQWFKRDEWLKMHNLIKTRINHACLFIGRLCAGRQWYWLDFQLIYTDTVPQIVELFLNGV